MNKLFNIDVYDIVKINNFEICIINRFCYARIDIYNSNKRFSHMNIRFTSDMKCWKICEMLYVVIAAIASKRNNIMSIKRRFPSSIKIDANLLLEEVFKRGYYL